MVLSEHRDMRRFRWWSRHRSTTTKQGGMIKQSARQAMPDVITDKDLWRKSEQLSQCEPGTTTDIYLAWAHYGKARWQRCQASTAVDATWPQRKRTIKEQSGKKIRSIWTAGCSSRPYCWRKMEAAGQNESEDGEEIVCGIATSQVNHGKQSQRGRR